MSNIAASEAFSQFWVLDVMRVRSGPTALRQLADWGADVTEVEPPASVEAGVAPGAPQVEATGIAQEIDTVPIGRTQLVGQPANLKRAPSRMKQPPPERGQHSDEILRDPGVEDAELSRTAGPSDRLTAPRHSLTRGPAWQPTR